MNVRHIKQEALNPNIWSGGKTFEYFIFPNTASYEKRDFLFRISSATIDLSPSTFTSFDNYTRYLVMLDQKLSASINGRHILKEQHSILKFQSSDHVVSETLGTDFNLMMHNSITLHTIHITKECTLTNDYIIIFAIEDMQVNINDAVFSIHYKDALIIQNTHMKAVAITIDKPAIIASIHTNTNE